MSTSLVIDTLIAEEMLCTRVANMVMLPDKELTTENEANIPIVRSLKG